MKGGFREGARAMPYTQVKVSVGPELAESFKSTCARSGLSMASVLSDFMAGYCRAAVNSRTAGLATRRQRRAVVKRIIGQLELVIDAETCYRDSIPANLQGSSVYEAADEAVSLMEEAAELLASAL